MIVDLNEQYGARVVLIDGVQVGEVFPSMDCPGRWAWYLHGGLVDWRDTKDEAMSALLSLWAERNGR